VTAGRPLIAVYGSAGVREGDAVYTLARDLGAELARAGADVMTGGYTGVMEACSRGALEAGGHTVGVTVELFEKRGPVNAYVRERVHTPDLFERLRHIIGRADGFIVVPGSIGTLAELFLTWNLIAASGRPPAPFVLVGEPWEEWLKAQRHPQLVLPEFFPLLRVTRTPAEAVQAVLNGSTARA
jgi:uncharacterized protein (TIGR00730 family)